MIELPPEILGYIISYIRDQGTFRALLLTCKYVNKLVFENLSYYPNSEAITVTELAKLRLTFKNINRVHHLASGLEDLYLADKVTLTKPCCSEDIIKAIKVQRVRRLTLISNYGQYLLRFDQNYMYLPCANSSILPLIAGRDFELGHIPNHDDWLMFKRYSPLGVFYVHIPSEKDDAIGNYITFRSSDGKHTAWKGSVQLLTRCILQLHLSFWRVVRGFRLVTDNKQVQVNVANAISELLRKGFPQIDKPFIFDMPVAEKDMDKLRKHIPQLVRK